MSQKSEQIIKWLESKDEGMLKITGLELGDAFIKYPLDGKFDLIYVILLSQDGELRLHDDAQYQGIFDRETKTLYDCQYRMYTILGDYSKNENNSICIMEDIESAVRQAVEERVRIDEAALKLNEVSTEELEKYKNSAEHIARMQYLRELECDNRYECAYQAEDIQAMIIPYLRDRDALIKEQTEKYLSDNKEEIRADIIRNALTEQVRNKYEDGSNTHLKTMRDIICAIPGECMTVNVTTVIDGKEMTFKTKASEMRSDCGAHYRTWNLTYKDREEFEELYGSSADYKPEDITKITYGRKVLYERKCDAHEKES